jgi:argininosuccinate synthase
MKKNNNYLKVASYEARKGEFTKVLLLYSGGLDTSVILKWIMDNYKVKVITLTIDMGQQKDNLEEIKSKAIKIGATKAISLDAKEEFASEYIAKGIKANASYQGDYHLSTPIGRALIAKKTIEVAKQEGVNVIAHGCTGKGNDQVRLDGYLLTLNPNIKILDPVREWNMDRNDEIAYAKKNNIPVPVNVDNPYSDDDNMWGMTWEGGEIEDPKLIAPIEKFLTTYTLAKKAEDKEEIIKLSFRNGLPFALNGKKMSLAKLITSLNQIAGKHGVGVAHVVEDKVVGLKNRGVYEMPAANVIISAHKDLEQYVSTRNLNEIKSMLDIKWAYLCYGAKWYDPSMKAINAFNDEVNKQVSGEVTLKLYKGSVVVIAMKSPFALAFSSFNNNEGYDFNVNASASFIEIHSLQMKLANQITKDK